MTDDADRSVERDSFIESQREEARRQAREAAAARGSAAECHECGNAIPKGRQRAIPGVRLCVECQEHRDAPGRHYRGGQACY